MKRLFTFFLCVSLAFSPFTFSAVQADDTLNAWTPSKAFASASETQEYVPGEVIVKFKKKRAIGRRSLSAESTFSAQRDSLAKRKKLEVRGNKKEQNLAVFQSKKAKMKDVIAELEADSSVEWVQPNYLYKKSAEVTTWNVGNGNNRGVNADIVHSDYTGNGVVVAVIDTGVDWDHEDLLDNHWTNSGEANCSDGIDNDSNGKIDDCDGWDFVGADVYNVLEDNDPNDEDGHGTHVSGTIAAVANNGVGLVGVAPEAKIMALKALDDNGSGSSIQVSAAIDYAVANGADVINMSLSGSIGDYYMETAVNNALAAGVTVVAASGNAGGPVEYPAAFPGVIAVGAIDSSNTIWTSSNTGPELTVVAPGVSIPSTYPVDLVPSGYQPYAYKTGTSMATPHIAGLVALYLEQNPTATPTQVETAIKAGIVDRGTAGRDDEYGSGSADAPSLLYGKASAGDIVMNELAWAGSTSHSSDEWIELRNTTNKPLNIGSFDITQNTTGTEEVMMTISDGMIPAGGLFLIAHYDDGDIESTLATMPNLVDGSLTLANANLQVKLYNGRTAASALELDVAGDGSIPFAGTSDAPKASMVRRSTAPDGALSSSWFTATLAEGFDNGATELGTPGIANEDDPVAPDTTAPLRSNGFPTSELPVGTTATVMSLETDEDATCKYDVSSETDYFLMANTFSTTGGMIHTTSLGGLIDGSTYNYYVRCEDTSGNENTDDFLIQFSVATPTFSGDRSDLFIRKTTDGTWHIKETNANATALTTIASNQWSPEYNFYPADFNGDGVDDLFIQQSVNGTWHVKLNDGSGNLTTSMTDVWSADYKMYPADFNGDGRDDVFIHDKVTGTWHVKTTDSGATSFTTLASGIWGADYEMYPADFNGDGLSDLYIKHPNGTWHVKTMTNGNFVSTASGNWSGYNPYTGDFNGDGVSDLFIIKNGTQGNGNWHVKTMSNGAFSTSTQGLWSGYNPYTGDFNGDGRDDVFIIKNGTTGTGNWHIKLAELNASGLTTSTSGLWSKDYNPFPADFNGDGQDDLFIQNAVSGTWHVKISGANAASLTTSASGNWSPDYEIYTGEFNGQ